MKPRKPRAKSKHCQKQDKKKSELVFDPTERIDFVKGFQKRKQERRERAKQEAADQEREIRKLLRQKRREAMKRARLSGSGHGYGAESAHDEDADADEVAAQEMKSAQEDDVGEHVAI